ncbi:MAG: hypothetical protein VXZ72_02955 [Chlamydiota bacterium]|nr:hypothetical protein [Chlamydiota bacterium]
MNYAVHMGFEQELTKIAKLGRFSQLKEIAKREARNVPNMPLDEKAAFLSGMFLNPIPGMSVTQLYALRGLKSLKHGLPGSANRRMNIRLERLKTPKNVVGK